MISKLVPLKFLFPHSNYHVPNDTLGLKRRMDPPNPTVESKISFEQGFASPPLVVFSQERVSEVNS